LNSTESAASLVAFLDETGCALLPFGKKVWGERMGRWRRVATDDAAREG
jgi:hypothetical protein